jgi:hypothetical protein
VEAKETVTRLHLAANNTTWYFSAGATLQFAGISFTLGRIKAIGTDARGKYWDMQIDAGYPTKFDQA